VKTRVQETGFRNYVYRYRHSRDLRGSMLASRTWIPLARG
jgi:hypothetical protein